MIVLVIFAVAADRFTYSELIGGVTFAAYIRVASLLGLVILLFYAIGFRQKIVLSQKYRRAHEVLAQAESDAERKQRSLEKARGDLEAEFKNREQAVTEQKESLEADYKEKIVQLKEQNIKLKETVSRLMLEIKKKKE